MRCAIVATGPSAAYLPPITANYVIAVNGAIDLVPCNVWFTLDGSPRNQRIMHARRPGVAYYAALPAKHVLPEYVTRLQRVANIDRGAEPEPGTPAWLMWRYSCKRGLSTTPGRINTGNSVWGALQLAVQFGAQKIALFGADASQAPRVTGGRPGPLAHLPELFASAMPQLQAAGIEVINGAPDSAIQCFERTTAEGAAEWLRYS